MLPVYMFAVEMSLIKICVGGICCFNILPTKRNLTAEVQIFQFARNFNKVMLQVPYAYTLQELHQGFISRALFIAKPLKFSFYSMDTENFSRRFAALSSELSN